MAIAIALGRAGIDTLLVVSQVILSIVLPFIALPLVYLTSSKKFMTVKCRVNCDRTFLSAMNTEGHDDITSGVSPRDRTDPRQDSNNGSSDEPFEVATNSVDQPIYVVTTFNPSTAMPTTIEDGGADVEECAEVQYIDYSNGPITTLAAYAVWSVIVVANVYVIVALAMGQGS